MVLHVDSYTKVFLLGFGFGWLVLLCVLSVPVVVSIACFLERQTSPRDLPRERLFPEQPLLFLNNSPSSQPLKLYWISISLPVRSICLRVDGKVV